MEEKPLEKDETTANADNQPEQVGVAFTTKPVELRVPPASPKEADPSIRSLRTFRGDVETVVRDQRASITSIAAAESNRRARGVPIPTEEAEPRFPVRWLVIIASFILIALSGLVLGVAFFRPSSSTDAVSDAPSLFFTEQQSFLDVGGAQEKTLLTMLSRERVATRLSLGSIRQLNLITTASTTRLLEGREFISRINGHAPAALARVALPPFVLGVHVFDGNQPFIILKVDPYEQAFAAMLEWEPFLLLDLSPLFTLPEGVSALTFSDEVINNKNVRIARNALGKPIALYSFLDRQTLFISTNEFTFQEVLSRLTRPRI